MGILVAQLEASLLSVESGDLAGAIDEHRAAVQRRERVERDPVGEIVVRRRGLRRSYSESPGRMNMISGTTHAGEVFSR